MKPIDPDSLAGLGEDMSPEARLAALGFTLPPVPDAVGDYAPWTLANGIIYTSGQLPWIDGDLKYVGKIGRDLSVEEGYASFQLSALNAIAQLQAATGDLSKIRQIVRLEGSAQTSVDFTEQPQVLNGASHLVNAVFGRRGRHSRMIYSDPAMCLNCATLVVLWAEVES